MATVSSFSSRVISPFTVLPQNAVHETYELAWVSRGRLAAQIEGQGQVELAPGLISLVPPGTAHSSWCMEETTRAYVLHLRAPVALPPTPSLRVVSGAVERAIAAIPSAHEAPSDLEPAATRIVEALGLAPPGDGSSLDPRLVRVLRAISEDPARPLSHAELARIAAMSPSQFSRVFNERVGQTPMRYLRGARVRLAARLLRTTERTVTDIAHATGFRSAARLSEAFRNVAGVAPSEYRSHASEGELG